MLSHKISMAKIKNKVIRDDIDRTKCSQRKFDYENPVLDRLAIKKVNELCENWATILVNISGYMGKEKSDIKKVVKNGYSLAYRQLKSRSLKFHKLKWVNPLLYYFRW